MKHEILHNIKSIARDDFNKIEAGVKESNQDVTASIDKMRFSVKGNTITASCDFRSKDSSEVIEASINYERNSNGIFADSEVGEVTDAILSAIQHTTITAADEDAMGFDDPAFDEDFASDFSEDDFRPEEDVLLEDEEEYEDPESDIDIETDNNIDGHYIVECDRCHGVFISALVESEQTVEYLSGICPLCEKESDQYVKWVIKPVKF